MILFPSIFTVAYAILFTSLFIFFESRRLRWGYGLTAAGGISLNN
nr:MAG TPA: hypothetical protein [Caudoviricetes sp.]